MSNNFEILEKIVLTVLLVCVFIAIGQEIFVMIENQKVTLADILLLFIYIEVLGMIKEYWIAKVVRMSYPLFIAMTALLPIPVMTTLPLKSDKCFTVDTNSSSSVEIRSWIALDSSSRVFLAFSIMFFLSSNSFDYFMELAN